MASSDSPSSSASSSSSTSSTSEPSPFATLPTELKLEIIAWTGIASPRALCDLLSTNRELRKLSEPQRWKNLPTSPAYLDNLPELIDTILPRYGHHIRLLRLDGPTGPEDRMSSEALTRYYDLIHTALPLMTGLIHLDVTAAELGANRTNLRGLRHAIPVLSKSLTKLTLSAGSAISGVAIGALFAALPSLTTLRLSWTSVRSGGVMARAFYSLHHLESLQISVVRASTMHKVRLSPRAPLPISTCAIAPSTWMTYTLFYLPIKTPSPPSSSAL